MRRSDQARPLLQTPLRAHHMSKKKEIVIQKTMDFFRVSHLSASHQPQYTRRAHEKTLIPFPLLHRQRKRVPSSHKHKKYLHRGYPSQSPLTLPLALLKLYPRHQRPCHDQKISPHSLKILQLLKSVQMDKILQLLRTQTKRDSIVS